MFQTITKSNSKYDKRYFLIDTVNGKLMYADKESQIEEPKFEVAFGSILGIKKNVCTMPIINDNASENGSQMSGNKSKKAKIPT